MRKIFLLYSLLFALSSITCAQRVRIGAEVLLEKKLALLSGKKVGIICNHTSIFPNGLHLVDSLLKKGINITALFSPEHGIRGTAPAGARFEDSVDQKTGIPIYSLYGKTKKPTVVMLKNVDVLIFDLQDVGARFYTYASTMAYAMQAAAENGKMFIVLDRPNPINGIDIEGPVMDSTLRSFIGMFPIPVRHGLTLGELAKIIVGERWMENIANLNLTVIPMEGWRREMWYDETGLPWVPPSPNMKTLSTAIVYPGTCLFEATNVSEGRGTNHPFEYIGAPWIDGDSLSATLNSCKLPGVHFERIQFTPMNDLITAPNPKYKNELSKGVSVKVTDRATFRPVESGLAMLSALHTLYPNIFEVKKESFDRLTGQSVIRERLQQGIMIGGNDLAEDSRLKQFKKARLKYLLY